MIEVVLAVPDWFVPVCLLLLSLVAVAIGLERLIRLVLSVRPIRFDVEAKIASALARADQKTAIDLCSETKDPAAQAVAQALQNSTGSDSGTFRVQGRRLARELQRRLNALRTISTVAPLFGLLGTVTGMIKSFHAFGPGGEQNAQLTGGIDEALITTALGLAIAIPTLLLYNFLATRANDTLDRYELLTGGSGGEGAEQ